MSEIEQATKHFEGLQKRYTTQHNGKHCQLVKSALEDMKEKAEREKGCEYCDTSKHYIGTNINNCGDDFFIIKSKNEVHLASDGKHFQILKINYCPMCGRKLSDDNEPERTEK